MRDIPDLPSEYCVVDFCKLQGMQGFVFRFDSFIYILGLKKFNENT